MSHGFSLKQRIQKGELILGVSAPISSDRARLEEILSKDSYDFVSTDSQHTAFNEEQLVKFCITAQKLDIPVNFRIKHTRHAYLIGNLLDLGPLGVEVPQVEEESTVNEAVDYFYYPQRGKRSWGGLTRYGFQGNEDRIEYAEWWNNHGVLWMQIESIEAICKARQLAKPGVDCLSWGAADLSFSRDAHPTHPLKTDDECVRKALKELEGTNTRLVYRNPSPNNRSKYTDMGVTVLLEPPKP